MKVLVTGRISRKKRQDVKEVLVRLKRAHIYAKRNNNLVVIQKRYLREANHAVARYNPMHFDTKQVVEEFGNVNRKRKRE